MMIPRALSFLPLALAIAVAASPGFAQTDPEEMQHHRMMKGSPEQHEAMMQKMTERQQRLDELVARMESAAGSQKVDAIEDVVRELVDQRQEMFEHMQQMHESRMQRMRESTGPGPEESPPRTYPDPR